MDLVSKYSNRALLLPLERLQPLYKTYSEQEYLLIKEDIQEDGLLYPIVALSTTYQDWRDMAVDADSFYRPADQQGLILLVMCGCNRYRAAKELGYTRIHAVLVDTKEEVNELCRGMRDYWTRNRDTK